MILLPNSPDKGTLDCPYDIGDIYHTTNAMHPANKWPGTEWEAIDKFLLGQSNSHPAGQTGGAETVSLTAAQNGEHSHSFGGYWNAMVDKSTNTKWGCDIKNTSGYTAGAQSMSSSGSGSPHENMPPYLAVYIWKRIS